MALTVTVAEKRIGMLTIYPVGSIDTETYKMLEKRVAMIMDAATKGIIFDMTGVEYITSMGVAVILNTKRAVESAGKMFLMVSMKPPVRKVFDIIKALPDQSVFESVEELDNYLTKIQQEDV